MTFPETLGSFLSARRQRLRPEDVSLPSYGDRRRVPGLRREEVAQLAGVGVSYYTRLEQGQSINASPQVLEALATALQLDAVERQYLHALAAPPPQQARRRSPSEHVSPATRQLLAAMGDSPALVLGRRNDVLTWNRAGHALFAGYLDWHAPDDPLARPNMARLVFLDPHTRELYSDWAAKARAVVGNLRLLAGRHPDDTRLSTLIGELSMQSTDFSSMWADHRVRDCDIAVYGMQHPLIGELTVAQQTLTIPAAVDQRLVITTAEPHSPAADALTLLARMTAPPTAPELLRRWHQGPPINRPPVNQATSQSSSGGGHLRSAPR